MALALLDDDATITVRDNELGVDDGDEGTVYTLRQVTPQVIKRLRREHTKRKASGGSGMVDVLDTEKFGEALFDYALASWSGVIFRGTPIAADALIETSTGATVKAKTQLDSMRKAALLDRAGGNAVVADTGESFRPSA